MIKVNEEDILEEINSHIIRLQNGRAFSVRELNRFEMVNVLDENEKEVISSINTSLEEIAIKMRKLVSMKEVGNVQELVERSDEFERETGRKISAEEVVQANLENMV